MASSATRKSPNAFMFCRQHDVLGKAGEDAQSFHVSRLIFLARFFEPSFFIGSVLLCWLSYIISTFEL